jgi:hypothetical protein
VAVGAALVLSVGALGCGATGEPSGGGLWRAHEVQVQTSYDTLPPASDTPVTVQFDTLRTSAGYPRLYARVTATNLSSRDLVGTSGWFCHWLFTAYDNPERAGEPLWNGESKGCRDAGLYLELPAGTTQVFPPTLLDFDEITKTRGAGTYYFAARLTGILGEGTGPSGWLTERVPAGAVVLLP